ncbi:MAG: phage major capsid protein [Clostridia bacterium]|nr:phage major capsid protein [Clostridia bacterium]
MRIDEIEVRKAEIRDLINSDQEFDVDALTEEVRQLDEEKAEIEARAQKEAELRNAVAPAVIEEIEQNELKEERKMENIEVRNSKEYINAFAEYLKTGNDKECRALLTENVSGSVAVPELVYDIVKTAWEREGIMALVRKSYLKGNLKVGFEISGDPAVIHTEGQTAPSEEALVLGTVNLIPASIKKWITISDEAIDMRGEEFIRYIYDELTYRIAKKAADTLVGKIIASPSASTTTAPAVPVVTASSISIGTIASAIANLSDEAANPVVIMNKLTYAAFKAAQYGAQFAADPFEGCQVLFNNSMTAFSAASTGDTYAIVGDLGHGALANFPNGDEITIKMDELSLAEQDLVKFVGREYVGLGVVAPNAFVKVTK